MVYVHSSQLPECSSTILRYVQPETHYVNLIWVVWINPHLTEDPTICATKTFHELIMFAGPAPRATTVI